MKEKEIFDNLIKFIENVEVFNTQNNKVHYGSLSISEVHCIDCIHTLDICNVTNIANKMKMTRGAITKITKKLIEKSYIKRIQVSENKKEVYFELEEKGLEVYEKHKLVHQKAFERETSLYKELNKSEQETVLKFLDLLNSDLIERLKTFD